MKYATFRQLRVFDAIVRHGSFTRAAEEMCLTQPTISIQIKKISDAVGLPLFEQIGKKVYLTEAGRLLHQFCHEVFDSMARLDMAITDTKGLMQGQLCVTGVTTAEYFLPRVLGEFCGRYPGIDVALKVANREQALERLKGNLDDLYVFGNPPQDIDVCGVPFLENPLVVVAPSSHPLANAKDIPIEKLTNDPFLLRERGSGSRMVIENFFAERGIPLKIRMELGSNEAIKQAVIGGLGLSVMSRMAVDHDNRLTMLDVREFPILKHWHVVYHRNKQLSTVSRAFLAYLESVRA